MRADKAARSRGFTDAELLAVYPQLFAYAVTLTRDPDRAQDLTQAAAELMLRYCRLYDPSKGKLAQWGTTIVRNALRQQLRKGSRKDVVRDKFPKQRCRNRDTTHPNHRDHWEVVAELFPNEFWACRSSIAPNQHAHLETREALIALDAMNGAGTATLLLALGEGHREIAAELGIAPGTVKSRVNRCRGQLDRHFGLPRPPGRRSSLRISKYR